MTFLSRFVLPGIAFILTLAFGLWLRRRGLVCGLFVSAALTSAGKLDHALPDVMHRIAPAELVIARASAVFLLGRRP